MKIVYRVVAAIAAILALPALYFLKLFQMFFDVTIGELEFATGDEFSLRQINQLVEKIFMMPGSDNYINFHETWDGFLAALKSLVTEFSADPLKEIIEKARLALNFSQYFEVKENTVEVLSVLKNPAIAVLVFFALVVVMALAVFICSAFTNARKVNLGLSIGGVAAVIGLFASFNHLVTVVTESLTITELVSAILSDSESFGASIASFFGLANLIGGIIQINTIQLTAAPVAVLAIFIFVACWTAAFMLIDMDAYKVPKEKTKHKKKKHN